MNKRIAYIDNAKGLLIAAVVLGHVLNYANPRYDILPYVLAQGFIGSFHMPAFFLLSGALFNCEKWSRAGWGDFLLRRAKTLLIPYAFFEMLAVLYKHFVLGNVSLSEGFLNMVTFRCNIGADWFLPALFLAEIFFFLYAKHPQRIIGWIAAAVSLFAAWYLPKGSCWNTLCRGLLGFGFIFIGNALKTVFLRSEMSRRRMLAEGCVALLLTGFFSAAGFLWFNNDFYICTVDNPLLFVLSGISGLIMVLSVARLLEFKWLRIAGENSLVIMGTHQLVLYTVRANSAIWWVVVTCVMIAFIEVAVIYLANRFCPFFIGKSK